jgi:hypothetical protein
MGLEFNEMQDSSYGQQIADSTDSLGRPSADGMAGFLISKGIAKDLKTANYILLGFCAVLFFCTYLILKNFVF